MAVSTTSRGGMIGRRWITLVGTAFLVLVMGVSAAGTFDDDDGGVHEPAIDALYVEDILTGTECGEGLICPTEPIQRWVIAVWLIRALDGIEPPGVASPRFVDVDVGQWWAPHVERLAELGVTQGCATNPARYCPNQPVTRAQVATLLTRAFDLAPGFSPGFVDIAGSSHADSIAALAAANLTAGCASEPARYCPDDAVTRGQMATFLMGVHHFCWFVWEGVVVELPAGEYCTLLER